MREKTIRTRLLRERLRLVREGHKLMMNARWESKSEEEERSRERG